LGVITTVLVVDDDDMVRRLAARMLTLEGYYVLEASSGEAALRTLQGLSARVRLVVTDLAMPGLDGRNLGGVVRRCWPQVRVLYMSGYPAARMIDTGALDMAWPFIQKPFTAEQLVRKVRGLIAEPVEQ
jgi:two-component system cell cycle sensor histidine kinase/response regulator CckA